MAALRFFFYLLMKPAALGFALLGLVGIFAPFTDPNQWWVPAFSGLFMPLILAGNLFLLLFWGLHKRAWVVLPLLAVSLNYQYFQSTFQWPWKNIQLTETSKHHLTIASYNIEGFYWVARDTNRYSVAKMVEKNNIDILCIQEHCEESNADSALILRRIGLPHRAVFFNRKTDWANFGVTLYSRFPIVRSGNIDFGSERNASIWADIQIGERDTIRIFNNHLQTTNVSPNTRKYEEYGSIKDWHGQARVLVNILEQLKTNFQIRARQAQLVRRHIDTTKYPVVICGDFNDTPISYAFNHIKGDDFTDSFIAAGKGYGHSFKGIKGLLRIDFVAYQSDFACISYHSPSLPWSDHNPVITKLAYNKKD